MIAIPIEVSEGGPVIERVGILYQELIMDLANPTYQDGDEAWYRINGHYNRAKPDAATALIYAQPNEESDNQFSILKNLNKHGNYSRFTRPDGTPLVPNETTVTNAIMEDHLYGKCYRYKVAGGNLLWHHQNAPAGYRVASRAEGRSLCISQKGNRPNAYVTRVIGKNRPRILTCTSANSTSQVYIMSTYTSSKIEGGTINKNSTNDCIYVKDMDDRLYTG